VNDGSMAPVSGSKAETVNDRREPFTLH